MTESVATPVRTRRWRLSVFACHNNNVSPRHSPRRATRVDGTSRGRPATDRHTEPRPWRHHHRGTGDANSIDAHETPHKGTRANSGAAPDVSTTRNRAPGTHTTPQDTGTQRHPHAGQTH